MSMHEGSTFSAPVTEDEDSIPCAPLSKHHRDEERRAIIASLESDLAETDEHILDLKETLLIAEEKKRSLQARLAAVRPQEIDSTIAAANDSSIKEMESQIVGLLRRGRSPPRRKGAPGGDAEAGSHEGGKGATASSKSSAMQEPALRLERADGMHYPSSRRMSSQRCVSSPSTEASFWIAATDHLEATTASLAGDSAVRSEDYSAFGRLQPSRSKPGDLLQGSFSDGNILVLREEPSESHCSSVSTRTTASVTVTTASEQASASGGTSSSTSSLLPNSMPTRRPTILLDSDAIKTAVASLEQDEDLVLLLPPCFPIRHLSLGDDEEANVQHHHQHEVTVRGSAAAGNDAPAPSSITLRPNQSSHI